MSQFIPNETKRLVPRDPPWITKSLKCMVSRKNRLFKHYKKHGYKDFVLNVKKQLKLLNYPT